MVLRQQVESEVYQRALTSSELEHKIKELGQEKAELKRKVETKVHALAFLHKAVLCWVMNNIN